MEQAIIPKTILVTGAHGQLGRELKRLSNKYPHLFLFEAKENLDIEKNISVEKFFENQQIDYCINCAAYTAVDKAETEPEKAFAINATAVGNLALICNQHHTKLIHISTDYVFNGKSSTPYKEGDAIDPINTYGSSKLKGEELGFKNNKSLLVIRTSWVYSSYGNNFVKTIIRLMKEKENINVVNDQKGSPTYAADLAILIMDIIEKNRLNDLSGIFNYCNDGVITWYQFALAIKELIQSPCTVKPVPSSEYSTPAKRPEYSMLDTTKIKSYGITIPNWKESLRVCLEALGYQVSLPL